MRFNNASSNLDETIRQNNVDILLQMLANNGLKDSLSLKEQRNNNNREQTELQWQTLDDYLQSDADVNEDVVRTPRVSSLSVDLNTEQKKKIWLTF